MEQPGTPAWIQLFVDLPWASWQSGREFWAAAAGGTLSPLRGERDQFATVEPADGAAWVKLQAVDVQPAMHLDLDSTDRDAALTRSLDLGASLAWTYEGVPVMRSPGGFTFCHTLLEGQPALARSGAQLLDQVCLDVPHGEWETESTFWAALTGRLLEEAATPDFRRLADPAGGPRILLQRRADDDGPVRAHPDFAVLDRPGETERHVDLGAELVGVHEWWTVLRAPGGQTYCLTDRDPATGSVARR